MIFFAAIHLLCYILKYNVFYIDTSTTWNFIERRGVLGCTSPTVKRYPEGGARRTSLGPRGVYFPIHPPSLQCMGTTIYILLYIPRGPREVPRASPSGLLSGLGKSLGRVLLYTTVYHCIALYSNGEEDPAQIAHILLERSLAWIQAGPRLYPGWTQVGHKLDPS